MPDGKRACSHGAECELPWSLHDWSYEAEVEGRVLAPRDVLKAEYHSGESCDCYPPSGGRPVMECAAWADGIIQALARSGYEIASGASSQDGPGDGHTFRIEVTSRGSYAVKGVEGHTDSDHFDPPMSVEVRAWNLPDALRQAAALFPTAWNLGDDDD